MKLETIHPYGVTIHDCSVDQVLQETEKLIELMMQHKILIFKNFEATPDQLVDINKKFGTPVRHVKWRTNALKTHPEIYVLHNDKTKGQLSASEYWHTDQSFMQCPPTFGFLYSITVARVGGTTIFSDQTAVYDDLPPKLKKKITGKVAAYRHATDYFTSAVPTPQELQDMQTNGTVYHPLVMPHCISGKNCLFSVHGHIQQILGLPAKESDYLLTELKSRAIDSKYVYEHHWEKRDFVIWDNLSMLHSARGTIDSLEDQYSREVWRMNSQHRDT
jgi:taurine dioxygenase